MRVDQDYLQAFGLGLQNLRATGQFCDAMVCVGSSKLLVHKVVLCAASQKLHDLALDFDMTPHRERDQLEIIIPPDISLYAVNLFIQFLYTGQIQINSRIVGHVERLATLYEVTRLQILCQEFIQENNPDSQNLESRVEPDSSKNGSHLSSRDERLTSTPDDTSQGSNASRSNSVCSGVSGDLGSSVVVKTEPALLASYETSHTPFSSPGIKVSHSLFTSSPILSRSLSSQNESSMSELEKLMSPVVNLQKLPSNITMDTVVMVSDDESDEPNKTLHKMPGYSLDEKEAFAIEAKRYGTAVISQTKNIPMNDLLSWMTLFGLRQPVVQRHGKQIIQEADLAIVRWIINQQESSGFVNIDDLKRQAVIQYQKTNPDFSATITWLGNFLQRNMSVLRDVRFVQGDKRNEVNIYGNTRTSRVVVKQEMKDTETDSGENVLETIGGNQIVLEDVPDNEQSMVNEALGMGVDNNLDDDDNYEDNDFEELDQSSEENLVRTDNLNKPRMIQTPWGKRPIIIGQSKAFDAKSERKIVQWVLERQERDGYVFTDDFKNYARSLYKGSKVFGATQAWMKKFLRRHRALKDVKFCSKFKNVYTTEEKVNSVALAKRFGVPYAAKHTGINQKVIHCWKLSYEKGMLNVDEAALMKINDLSTSFPDPTLPHGAESVTASGSGGESTPSSLPSQPFEQAIRGMVPEFEHRIVQNILDLQAREGSVNYSDISKISQSIYKETRPNFKASYNWVKTFLERHKEALANIELENVSKVLVESDNTSIPPGSEGKLSNEIISEMVDQALKVIDSGDQTVDTAGTKTTADRRPVIVGPSVTFDRKTEKRLVEWALEKQATEGFVFTDDFKLYAKSLHTGNKVFSASSGWMTLFLRRHRVLKDVVWRSKYKNNYTEEEKMAAVEEARRLGAGHVGRKLGIEPKLICTWRIKMEKNAPKQQSFWKGTKIRKFGKGPMQPKYAPIKHTNKVLSGSDAARGIVPEFEHRIIDLIQEEHEREGSISYEEMSRLAQSVYKETRPSFKASYAWIRNFMKRNEDGLSGLNIDNVKKIYQPDEEEDNGNVNIGVTGDAVNSDLQNIFKKRPIIVGQSRSLDTKTEKKLVQWTVEQQQKNGYVFLDQFKTYAQSLYKGEKKFAATQAWRIKFLRRNHAALKGVKFQSSFRNQYTLEEKKAIVLEARKLGPAHVAKKTGIEHCLINAWKIKLERSGVIAPSDSEPVASTSGAFERPNFASKANKVKKMQDSVGPGLYSYRGIVPAIEKKIVSLIMMKMDEEGSVSYQDVSNIARAVYKETRPHFKACYNWVKDFLKRNKKALKHVEWEQNTNISTSSDFDMEVLIPEAQMGNIDDLIQATELEEMTDESAVNVKMEEHSADESSEMDIVIDNPEDPNYNTQTNGEFQNQSAVNIEKIVSKRPIIIGKAVHFNRKTEKKIVEWLLEAQNRDGFVFTDDLRRYARSLYTGPPEKFGATNAWITKFLRRHRLEGQIEFQSKLKGNNAKFEAKICELIQEQQAQEGSVSNEDIQKITQAVYRETRPNFRACYGWIKDFIKRNRDLLAGVDLENVKKLYIPDDDSSDGVIVQNYDPMNAVAFLEPSTSSNHSDNRSRESSHGFSDQGQDSSWVDMDSSVDLDSSRSQGGQSQNVLERMATQKRPIIIGPPRGMDSKTEKKLVQWMLEQQEQDGCVYLDLFKQYAKSIHEGPKKFAATQAWMVKFKQRNREALKNVVIRSRFRNEYTMEEKMSIVEEAKRLGCNHVGRKLGINGGVIYSWKVQLEQLDKFGEASGSYDAPDSSQQTSTRGIVPQFETAIVQMVLETQRAKGSVTYDDVSMCAISVYKETRPNFKASTNWVLDFIRKYKEEFKDVKFENQRKFHSEDEKLHILSEEKKYGTDHVVKKRNISASTLYTWRRNMKAKSIPIPKYKAIVSSKIKKKYARGKTLKTYTLEEKRNIVSIAEANGVTYASLKLGVTRNMIGKWIRYFRDQGENIVINFTYGSTKKKELEQKIIAWVLEENETLGIVLTSRIIQEAKRVFEAAYTGFNATQNWLEGFLSQNSQKFENVRFREPGDQSYDFSDQIKLKICRYSEQHGAVSTAELTGLSPKAVYHWRRAMKLKGYDFTSDELPVATEEVKVESTSSYEEPKSAMQQKLDSIASKFHTQTRKSLVLEATVNGASATAKKHKLPLPLLLNWMKKYGGHDDEDDDENDDGNYRSVSESSNDGTGIKLKVKLPSMKSPTISNKSKNASKETKRQIVEEVNMYGVKGVCDRRGIAQSTVYNWLKEHRESSEESNRASSHERTPSRSSIDRESITPVLIRNIKQEPGTVNETSVKTYEAAAPKRKYTYEEKLEVVRRAIETTQKGASIELGIPLSNIKRWSDMYKGLIYKISAGTSTPKPNPSKSSSPAVSTSTKPTGVSKDFMREASIERKRRLSEIMKHPETVTKRMKYTEEERIQFVKDTEVMGSSAVANKAMVSIDIVYKWRSKYLKAIKQAEREQSESTEEPKYTTRSSPRKMPEPRNPALNLTPTHHDSSMDYSSETDSNSLAYLSVPVTQNPGDSNSFSKMKDMSESNVTFDDFSSMKSDIDYTDTDEHYNDVSMDQAHEQSEKTPGVENINDIDILAVDHILEMTSSYMEAEKRHKADPLGIKDASSSNTKDAAVIDDDSRDVHDSNDIDLIQIVDVQSQANSQ